MAWLLHTSILHMCASAYVQVHKLLYKEDPRADLINHLYRSEVLDESLREMEYQPHEI